MEKKEPSYNVGGNVNSNNKLWRSVFIPIPKKGNSKKCSKYHTIALISHARKVMLEIFKLAFSSSWELPGIHARKGRGTRDLIANICQSIRAFLVAQTVKSLPTMRETHVQSLGCEDPLKEGLVTHSSVLVWRVSLDRGAWKSTVQGVTKSQSKGILEKHLLHWLC